MKMTIKSFERESNKSMKEKEKLIVKARQALAKNNEEGARLFLE
jgi:phage shock protein A